MWQVTCHMSCVTFHLAATLCSLSCYKSPRRFGDTTARGWVIDRKTIKLHENAWKGHFLFWYFHKLNILKADYTKKTKTYLVSRGGEHLVISHKCRLVNCLIMASRPSMHFLHKTFPGTSNKISHCAKFYCSICLICRLPKSDLCETTECSPPL